MRKNAFAGPLVFRCLGELSSWEMCIILKFQLAVQVCMSFKVIQIKFAH